MREFKIKAVCSLCLLFLASLATAQQVVPPPSVCPRPCYYYLTFVSDGVTPATSTNIATYNSFVMGQASNLNTLLAGSGVGWIGSAGKWYALGSTSSVNASQNIPTLPYPIFNVQNPPGPFQVSVSPFAWLNLPLLVGENIGQDGNHAPNFNAWTGTNNTGGTATSTPLGSSGLVTHSNVVGSLTNWIDTGDGLGPQLEQMYAISNLLYCAGPGAACTVPCSGPGPTALVDWAQFRFVPCHSGFNPYELLLSPSTVGNLVLNWKFATGGNLDENSPAVANGAVYFTSTDHNVYARNANTGAMLWTYPTGNANFSSPAVANQKCHGIPTSMVYVGSEDDNVYALDSSNGALCWNYTTGNVIFSSPAVSNGMVYIASLDKNVYGLNADTGAFGWKYTTGDIIYSSPAVANGVVYVGSYDHYLYALDAGTGGFLWSYQTGAEVVSSPAVANGVVYFASDFPDNTVYALNASTGALLWKYTTGSGTTSSPAVANGVVYIGFQDNNLYALDAGTGAFLWKYTTGDQIYSSPAVANGVVYVGSNDNNLYALNAGTGALLWKYTTGDTIHSSPAVANGMVYVGSNDDTFYAFKL